MSKDVNKTTLVGRVAAEAEMRFLADETMVSSFSLYTNESWKDKMTGEWKQRSERHNVVAFGARAEYAGQLATGQRVEVEGKLQTRSWTDANDVKHFRTEINATLVRPLPDEPKTPTNQADEAEEVVEPISVEELPF